MNKLEFRMDIPSVTREYTPGSCRNSRKPMRLPPRHERRPHSPALHAEQLRFPKKHIRSLDLVDWTLESPQQDCHKTRRTLNVIKIKLHNPHNYLMCVCSVAQFCLTLCDPINCSLLVPSSMGFSWQEYWSGLPFHPPGDPPNPGTESMSSVSWIAGKFFITELQGKPHSNLMKELI